MSSLIPMHDCATYPCPVCTAYSSMTAQPGIDPGIKRANNSASPEPVPAWAARMLSDQARWAGLWSGCADGLARLLRRHAEDPDVAHALRAYQELAERFRNPLVIVPGESREGNDG